VLPIPLSLVVTDAYTSQPLAGVVVTCKPGSVGGELDPSPTQTTDATGTVTYTYQLPRKPTPVTINCSSRVSTTAVFHETSTTGPPAHMNIASGNKQTAPPNTPLAAPLKVKVGDAKGFGVAGVTVSFTDNAAGGAFTASSAITDANGNASTQYTTGPNTGTVKITASTAGVKSVIFTVTVQ
jgi:hypothetical protein